MIMLRAILAFVLAIVTLFNPPSGHAQQPSTGDRTPFIITLGGIKSSVFFRTATYGEVHITAYLADALANSWAYDACFLQLERCPIQEIFWSGDLRDTSSLNTYVSNTRAVLQRIKERYPDRDIIIIAHSWGSVVAYDILTQLAALGWHPGDVALVISLGSPLGSQCSSVIRPVLASKMGSPLAPGLSWIGDETLAKPNIVSRWVNIWTASDKISGPLRFADSPPNMNIRKEFLPNEFVGCASAAQPITSFRALAQTEEAHNAYYQVFLNTVRDVIAEATQHRVPKKCVDLLHAAIPVPNRFGAAYDVVTGSGKLLLETSCTALGAAITVGRGLPTQYVYRYGYQWRNENWVRFDLRNGTLVGGNWYVGEAFAELERTPAELRQNNFVAAYVCTWVGGQWKCGCRDSACAQPFWQLQAFHRE